MIEIFETCQTKFIANQNIIVYLYVSLHIGYNLFGKFSILK